MGNGIGRSLSIVCLGRGICGDLGCRFCVLEGELWEALAKSSEKPTRSAAVVVAAIRCSRYFDHRDRLGDDGADWVRDSISSRQRHNEHRFCNGGGDGDLKFADGTVCRHPGIGVDLQRQGRIFWLSVHEGVEESAAASPAVYCGIFAGEMHDIGASVAS